jgi:hypothetical protein
MRATCPSGLVVEVREMQASEANIFADRKSVRRGEVYDKILKACTLEVIDSGIYSFPTGSPVPDWGKVYACDRFYTLIMIRIASLGETFEFPYRCPSCEHEGEWSINLSTDLEVFDLPAETRQKLQAGTNAFEADVAGKRFTFKIMNGNDEKRASKDIAANQSQVLTRAIGSRIVSVDELKAPESIHEAISKMPIATQWQILEEFERIDGGVEQNIEIECEKCGKVIKVTLPFSEGDAFWIPRKKQSKSSGMKKAGRTSRRIG